MENFTIAVFVLILILIAYYFFGKKIFNPSSIRGKRVLVTGASSGIGEKVAYRYAELGAKLVITARRSDLLDKVAANCKAKGAQAVFTVPADMATPADRIKVTESTQQLLGGLDILILNHAILDWCFWKNTAENMVSLEQTLNVNFTSYVDISSRLTEALERSRGCVGVVSSILGKFGRVEYLSYCSSKHALQGFYSALRHELRRRKSGMSITLAVFGPITSEHAVELVSQSAAGSAGFVKYAGTTEDAADVLVRGVAERRYEIYFPFVTKLSVFFYKFFPNFVENVWN